MYLENGYGFKKAQYQDMLREAEKERLINQLMARREGAAVWQRINDVWSDAVDAGKRVPMMMKLRNAH